MKAKAKTGVKKTASKAKKNGSKRDIINLILEDHKPLKKLIKVLKSDSDFAKKQAAFAEFAPLLISHAKPEEETLYIAMKAIKDMRADGLEGDTEHTLADQLVEEGKRTSDKDLWTAKVKVLAELVEHHLKEEEEDIFPDFKKHSDLEERTALGEKYASMREQLLAQGGEDSPHEKGDKAVFSKKTVPAKHHLPLN